MIRHPPTQFIPCDASPKSHQRCAALPYPVQKTLKLTISTFQTPGAYRYPLFICIPILPFSYTSHIQSVQVSSIMDKPFTKLFHHLNINHHIAAHESLSYCSNHPSKHPLHLPCWSSSDYTSVSAGQLSLSISHFPSCSFPSCCFSIPQILQCSSKAIVVWHQCRNVSIVITIKIRASETVQINFWMVLNSMADSLSIRMKLHLKMYGHAKLACSDKCSCAQCLHESG